MILSLRVRERIPGVPVASQEEALSTGKARGTPGSWHHSRLPQMSQSIPGKPVFPAMPRLSSRGSTHTTLPRGTALWESLVGKPRGKATDPLIHAKGSVTMLLQLESKAHLYAPTRECSFVSGFILSASHLAHSINNLLLIVESSSIGWMNHSLLIR